MWRWALSAVLSVFAVTAPAFAQVQTIGDVSFAVPDGWTYQGSADGGLMLLKQEQNFWIISVHAPRPTSGDPNADFKNAWRSVVLPMPDFQRSLPGYDPYDITSKSLGYPGKYYDANSDSGKLYVRLYTLETGKVVVPVMVLSVNRQVFDLMEHMALTVVGSVRLAPLKASPIKTTLTLADLAGDWKSGMANSISYYSNSTGRYVGSTQTFYGAGYHIAANGSFTYKMAGMADSRIARDEDSGVVELGGEFVTFRGRNHVSRYRFLNIQTALDGSTVLTLLPPVDMAHISIIRDSSVWSREPKK
jgi:hypothetical protein